MDQRKPFKFVSLWVGTTILALILNAVLGSKFTLGNAGITMSYAGIIVGFALTAAFFLSEPASKKLEIKIKDERIWAGIFFFLNSAIIWVLKRLADFTGVGASSVVFVLIIAAILTAGQYLIDKYVDKMLSSK